MTLPQHGYLLAALHPSYHTYSFVPNHSDGLCINSISGGEQPSFGEGKSERYSTPQWRICVHSWTNGGANGGCSRHTGWYNEVMGGFHTSAIQWRINGQEELRLESPPFLLLFFMFSFLAFKLVSHFIWQRPNPCTHITQAFQQVTPSHK